MLNSLFKGCGARTRESTPRNRDLRNGLADRGIKLHRQGVGNNTVSAPPMTARCAYPRRAKKRDCTRAIRCPDTGLTVIPRCCQGKMRRVQYGKSAMNRVQKRKKTFSSSCCGPFPNTSTAFALACHRSPTLPSTSLFSLVACNHCPLCEGVVFSLLQTHGALALAVVV